MGAWLHLGSVPSYDCCLDGHSHPGSPWVSSVTLTMGGGGSTFPGQLFPTVLTSFCLRVHLEKKIEKKLSFIMQLKIK